MNTNNKFLKFVKKIESENINDFSEYILLSSTLDKSFGSGTTNRTCSNSASSCIDSINGRCTNSSSSDCSNSMNRHKCQTQSLQSSF